MQAEIYEYDSALRLTRVNYDDGSFIAYEYDARGNITLINRQPPDLPDIEASPATIDFGPVLTGSTATLALALENKGSAALEITAIGVLDNLSSPYGFGADSCEGQVLLPTQTCVLELTYEPTAPGQTAETFSIESNDPDEAKLIIDVTGSGAADDDGDGVPNPLDNCLMQANGDQTDADGDGYGNICDADFDNNNRVDFSDLAFFRSRFFTPDPDADLDGNGRVDFADLAILKSMFFDPPGPSGLVP